MQFKTCTLQYNLNMYFGACTLKHILCNTQFETCTLQRALQNIYFANHILLLALCIMHIWIQTLGAGYQWRDSSSFSNLPCHPFVHQNLSNYQIWEKSILTIETRWCKKNSFLWALSKNSSIIVMQKNVKACCKNISKCKNNSNTLIVIVILIYLL